MSQPLGEIIKKEIKGKRVISLLEDLRKKTDKVKVKYHLPPFDYPTHSRICGYAENKIEELIEVIKTHFNDVSGHYKLDKINNTVEVELIEEGYRNLFFPFIKDKKTMQIFYKI